MTLFIKKLLVEVNRGLPQAQLHQGVKSTLVKLRSLRKKMVIVTSSLKKFVWPALENHQLVDLIDGFLSIEDIEKNKPDPEIVNKALEKLNGSKNRAIIIGDSDKDVFTGQNAGIKTMIFFPAINQRFYTLEELSQLKPDYLITDFTEILNLV